MDYLNQIYHKSKNGLGDSDKHLLTLFSIALGSGAKNILELGVRNGDTTLPLLLAAKENDGVLISVDVNDTTFVCPDDLKPYWKFYKTDSLKFLKDNCDNKTPFDLIFIDDWHSYEHVKLELEYVDQMVTPKSVILLHDLMYGNTAPYYHVDLTKGAGKQWENGGPYKAVAELNDQFWEFSTLPYNNGLTLLRKKYSNKYHIHD